MDETNITWDTEETSRIIANDEGLYNIVTGLESVSWSIAGLAELMEEELSDIIDTCPYSDVDMSAVDWCEIASEYMEE